MKTRPSGEKRRKEMQRQERNREKAERRKLRKEEKLKSPEAGTEGDPDAAPSDGAGQPIAPESGADASATTPNNASIP